MVSKYEQRFRVGDLVKIVYIETFESQYDKRTYAYEYVHVGWIEKFYFHRVPREKYICICTLPNLCTIYILEKSVSIIKLYSDEVKVGNSTRERIEEIRQNPKYLTHKNTFVRDLARKGLKL